MGNRYPGMHGNRQIVSLLLIRQGFACFYCGRLIEIGAKIPERRATLDHKTALVFGGEPFGENAVAACRMCNGTKGSLDAETFLAVRGDPPRRRRLEREAQQRIAAQTKDDRRLIHIRIKRTHRVSRQKLLDSLQPVLDAYKAALAQQAEAGGLNPLQSRFESGGPHQFHAPVAQLVEAQDLGS